MPIFTFSPQIDLGHILTFVTLVGGLVALYLQARSVRISERELSFQVTELQEVVQRLKAESDARQRLESAQQEHIVQQLHNHAEQLNYSTFVYDHFKFVGGRTESLQRHRLVILAMSLASIARSLTSSKNQEALGNSGLIDIVDLNNALIEVLRVEEDDHQLWEVRLNQWDQEFKALLEQVTCNDSPAMRHQVDNKRDELIRLTTERNVRLAAAIELPQQRYREVNPPVA